MYDWIEYENANPACNYTSIELIGLYTVVLNRSVITGTEKCQYFWIYIGCALLYNASDVEYNSFGSFCKENKELFEDLKQ